MLSCYKHLKLVFWDCWHPRFNQFPVCSTWLHITNLRTGCANSMISPIFPVYPNQYLECSPQVGHFLFLLATSSETLILSLQP